MSIKTSFGGHGESNGDKQHGNNKLRIGQRGIQQQLMKYPSSIHGLFRQNQRLHFIHAMSISGIVQIEVNLYDII